MCFRWRIYVSSRRWCICSWEEGHCIRTELRRCGAAALRSCRPTVCLFIRSLRSRRFRSSLTGSVNQKAPLCPSSSEVSTSFLDLTANFGGKRYISEGKSLGKSQKSVKSPNIWFKIAYKLQCKLLLFLTKHYVFISSELQIIQTQSDTYLCSLIPLASPSARLTCRARSILGALALPAAHSHTNSFSVYSKPPFVFNWSLKVWICQISVQINC